jgi:hypothetical protein
MPTRLTKQIEKPLPVFGKEELCKASDFMSEEFFFFRYLHKQAYELSTIMVETKLINI